jgi:type II secretory pathway component PulF
LLTGISGSVIAILVVFVLPRFATIFAQYEVPLPIVTQALLAVAAEFRARWWLWLPLTAGAMPLVAAWRLTDTGRRVIDGVLLKGAIVRDVTRPLLIGRACAMLGLLLQSGVPLLEAIRLCREAINNRLYKELFAEVEDSVINGHGMGAVLSASDFIPTSAREMIATAERTGNLTEVADLLGEYYQEEAESRMKQMVRIIEPLITVGMGLVVAVVVLSVMLPIFDLSTVAH